MDSHCEQEKVQPTNVEEPPHGKPECLLVADHYCDQEVVQGANVEENLTGSMY